VKGATNQLHSTGRKTSAFIAGSYARHRHYSTKPSQQDKSHAQRPTIVWAFALGVSAVAGKKRNLSKIAGLHTGTDKNGKTFYFGEVNEGCTLLILPNMNGDSDGAGRFDFVAYFVPNNRYEPGEDETPDTPAVPVTKEATPVDEKPKEIIKPKEVVSAPVPEETSI